MVQRFLKNISHSMPKYKPYDTRYLKDIITFPPKLCLLKDKINEPLEFWVAKAHFDRPRTHGKRDKFAKPPLCSVFLAAAVAVVAASRRS